MNLNPKQKLFCRYYATSEVKTRGNATKSYMAAYPDSSEEAAAVSAHELLRKPKVVDYLKELWRKTGLTDEEVDAELAGIVRQNKDLKSKLGGIKEYNRLKERGAEIHKIDVYDKYKDEQ